MSYKNRHTPTTENIEDMKALPILSSVESDVYQIPGIKSVIRGGMLIAGRLSRIFQRSHDEPHPKPSGKSDNEKELLDEPGEDDTSQEPPAAALASTESYINGAVVSNIESRDQVRLIADESNICIFSNGERSESLSPKATKELLDTLSRKYKEHGGDYTKWPGYRVQPFDIGNNGMYDFLDVSSTLVYESVSCLLFSFLICSYLLLVYIELG